ncbi:DUF4253 domain-containing protein [Nocardia sp. NPDC048505]|uniref:DUF4253 domain-containing protein n=1 Tax=Nocardia sp. NPDC048505 TaxID=3155756 RepID=UPI003408C62E
MRDFDCPPFRPDPTDVPAPAPLWQGTDPRELIAEPGLADFKSLRESELNGSHVWITLCEPGYEAAGLWRQYRERYDQTGLWPLLMNPETLNVCERRADPQFRIISQHGLTGHGITAGQDWFDTRYSIENPDAIQDGDPTFRTEEDWSDPVFAAANSKFGGFDWADILDAVGGTFYQMLLVPAPFPWLVPGVLGWSGALNDNLGWREHASVLRRWQLLWGTELIGLESDMMWLRHIQPIQDRDTALSAALEAFLYCPDSVHQGHLSLDCLAKALLEPMWRFWWD